jgi:tetratricopeptide (TPR) repeat protein
MTGDLMPDRVAKLLLGALLLASVFALAVTQIQDYDAWTHLSLGRDIFQLRGLPATEQFNFPSLDMSYHNAEWLFGLVFYLAYLAAGISGVILLKASIITLAFFILFKDSLIPRDPESHGSLGVVTAGAGLFMILLMVRHRFVERPDLALMLFLSFTIYALNAYVYEGRRSLYILPALQVLWVNMHPSIVVGAVPFGAFLAGGSLQRVLRDLLGWELAVALAALLNPYGTDPILAPFRLSASTFVRHEVMELEAPGISDFYGAPYIVTGLLGLVFLFSLRRLSIGSVLLVVPFIQLGLSARRFVFLLAIVAAPILVRHLRLFAGRLRAGWAGRVSFAAGVVATSLIVAVTGLLLARVGPFVDPWTAPGFGVYYDPLPEGPLRYLDRIGMTGRLYNTSEFGGYIAWRDYPGRIPIVDGRRRVPFGLRDRIQVARFDPQGLNQLQEDYGFDVAVVKYPRGTEVFKGEVPDVDLALTSPDWALVYWDDLSLVYLKRAAMSAKIIERDEYRHVKPANGLPYFRRKLRDPNQAAPIEAELRRNIALTRSAIGYTFLGVLYNEVGSHRKAIETLSLVRDFPIRSHLKIAYAEIGLAYHVLGEMQQAIAYYKKAARYDDQPRNLYLLGAAFEKIGNDREAVRYLERALERDRWLVAVYPVLIRAYRRLGRADRLLPLEAAHREALVHGDAEEQLRKGVRFYYEGRLREAMVALQKSIRLNPNNPAALSKLGSVYFDLGLLDKALVEQKRALDIDPDFADAHYGLALVHSKRRNHVKARTHLEEYLRVEPQGYRSRGAREQLSRILGL